MATKKDLLLASAAAVCCELSAGQAEALAYDVERARSPKRIRQVAGLAAPKVVTEMCDLWIDSQALDAPGLADAIRCASRAVKTVSSYEKVELLYTGPDSRNLRRNLQGLLEVIRSSRERLWVVSFVIRSGVDDVIKAMAERAAAGVEVNVLLDHRADGYGGAVKKLAAEAPGTQLLLWPDERREFAPKQMANLHAKCAVADGRQAYVSSANLTGWAMDHNLEVGYLVTGGPTPQRLHGHLDALLDDGQLIDAT